ncbi:MAG: HD domain-containing protein [Candidatus Magasanikbacteria bacterium]|nr:HD domain-containing protein [Candidatus Magasanikbacteria bacterium]MCA9391001.1 HD domain-containing protein [Candidatus Magasanikbacteria bacterium]USN52027.1 MAG: HD domain-containing protein [Candidatus Nomurabacteria bacterium]
MMTRQQVEQLVAERIPGTRKGSDEPAYLHSIRVGQTVEKFGYSKPVIIAAILHDVIEDGGVTYEELEKLGCTEEIIELVTLCTHDDMIEGGDGRWVDMMAGLVHAYNPDAWAIKIADAWDNMKGAETMDPTRRRFLRQAKAPMLAAISHDLMKDTAIWKAYKEDLEIYRDRV